MKVFSRQMMRGLLLLLAGSPAFALFPESGIYWNPDEPGRGYLISVQDDNVFFAAYLYTAAGPTVWYASSGTLVGDDGFVASLDGFQNGQCLTCAFQAPEAVPGAAGNVDIVFTSPVSANIIWAGGTFDIVRFFHAPTQQNLVDSFIGEWAITSDFTGTAAGFPFEGEFITLDVVDVVDGDPVAFGLRTGTVPEDDRLASGLCIEDDILVCGFTVLEERSSNAAESVFSFYLFDAVQYGAERVYVGAAQRGSQIALNLDGVFTAVRTASATFVQNGTGPSVFFDTVESKASAGASKRASYEAMATALKSRLQAHAKSLAEKRMLGAPKSSRPQ